MSPHRSTPSFIRRYIIRSCAIVIEGHGDGLREHKGEEEEEEEEEMKEVKRLR